jgi:ribonuclease P protein component
VIQGVQALKTRAQFDAVLAGQVLAKTAHFVLHGRTFDTEALTQLGLPHGQTQLSPMVPKRWARRSVTRNLIKRQIRAIATEQAEHLAQRSYVVRLRAAFDKRIFVSASSDALRTVVRLELQKLFAQIPHPRTPAPDLARPSAGLEPPTTALDAA